VTEQNRRDETAQPGGAAQSGQPQTDPVGEPVRQSGPPKDTDAANASGGEKPEQTFVARDRRRKPSPRPRPASGPDGGPPHQSQQSGADSAAASGTDQVQPDAAGSATGTAAGESAATGDDAAGSSDTAAATADKSGGFAAELEALRSDLDERTRDLQRITAEYANYRRRVERDRRLVADQATATVLNDLLGVLDDLDRARTHGDLVGPFGAVAEQLTSVLAKLGLSPFGEKGDVFDPTRHEAVAHSVSTEVTEPTCVEVFRRGYLYGERLLRPALVAVADPVEEEPAGSTDASAAVPPAPADAAQASADRPAASPGGNTTADASVGRPGEPGEPGGPATPETSAAAAPAAGTAASDATDTASPGSRSTTAGQTGRDGAAGTGAPGSHNEKSAGDA
jgi:molecular chaperone GrpE